MTPQNMRCCVTGFMDEDDETNSSRSAGAAKNGRYVLCWGRGTRVLGAVLCGWWSRKYSTNAGCRRVFAARIIII